MTPVLAGSGIGEASAFELAAPRASYAKNQHTITLSRHVRIIDRSGGLVQNPRPEDLATLIHEYVHYLHNYSTLAGLTQLSLHHQLGLHLSTTVDSATKEYFAAGGKDRSDQAFRTTLDRLYLLDGDHELPVSGTAYRFTHGGETYEQNGKVLVIKTAIRVAESKWRNHLVRVGLRAIEESIAFELQCVAARALGGAEPKPPMYPYLALRKLRDAYCPRARLRDVLRVAVLAMNVPSMAQFLVNGLVALGHHRNRRSARLHRNQRATLEREKDCCLLLLSGAPYREAANALPAMFKDRGLLEDAAAKSRSLIIDLVQLRLRGPWFEIEAVENLTGSAAELRGLLEGFLPCEVIQEFGDGTSTLMTFGTVTDDEVAARRAMQGHIHMVNCHLTPAGLRATQTVEAETDEGNRCPFFGMCDLELRHRDPTVCRVSPWRRGSRTPGAKTCWYGHGAAMTFATGPRPTLGGAQV